MLFLLYAQVEGVKMNLVPWNVVQGDGSVRSRYDTAYRDSVIMPQVKEAVYHELNMIPVQQMPPENGVTFDTGFWLNNKENRLQLKRIVSYIQSKYSAVKLLKVDDMTIEIRFDIPRRSSWRIVFDKDFPSRAPYVVRYEAGETTSWSLGALGKNGTPHWLSSFSEMGQSVINRLKYLSI